MKNRQTRCSAIALAGWALVVGLPTGSASASDIEDFAKVARELNAAPTLPAQFIDPDGPSLASMPAAAVALKPSVTPLADAQRFIAAELAAAEASRGSTAFGSPPPSGSGFNSLGLMTRTAHSDERQRDPVARPIPLPHAAGLSVAGLIFVGLFRRRRIEALG